MDFEERDIQSGPQALRGLVEDHNRRATPTLVVGGRVWLGFDPSAYEGALRDISP